jgi:hypothetical protein
MTMGRSSGFGDEEADAGSWCRSPPEGDDFGRLTVVGRLTVAKYLSVAARRNAQTKRRVFAGFSAVGAAADDQPCFQLGQQLLAPAAGLLVGNAELPGISANLLARGGRPHLGTDGISANLLRTHRPKYRTAPQA